MPEASVKDVAALARVSVGTVSNVLNRPDRVSPTTRLRVQDAIQRLGFVRNDAARQLRAGSSRTIGLVIQDASNPFFTDLARGAQRRANEFGISVLLGNADHQDHLEAEFFELFREQRVKGLLVSPLHDSLEHLDAIRRQGVPIVVVDRDASAQGYRCVAADDVAGGAMAARHMVETGRRHLVYAGGDSSIRQIHDRVNGARAVVAGTVDATLDVLESSGVSVSDGRELGVQIYELSRSRSIDGVLAGNDLVAIGILQALLEAGVDVPGDIALIGYDDISFAYAATIPLSSIRQPSELMGSTAVDLLLDHASVVEGTGPIVFKPELVLRRTTGSESPKD